MTAHRERGARSNPAWTWIACSACLALWLPFAGARGQAPPSRAELEAAAYVAALDSVFAEDSTSRIVRLLGRDTMPRLVLVDRMGADPVRWLVMLMGVPEPPIDSAAAARAELERRKIPRDLAKDFVAANLRPDSLSVPIASGAPSYFATLPPMSPAEQGALFNRRRAELRRAPGRPAYPEPGQILRLSRAGFSPDRRHSLVYVETYCGPLCASGTLVRLSRDGERWRVVESLELWVS